MKHRDTSFGVIAVLLILLALAAFASLFVGCQRQPVPIVGPATTPVPATPAPVAVNVEPARPVPATPGPLAIPSVISPPAEQVSEAKKELGPTPLIALPAGDDILTDKGRALIIEFEVGGGKAYYEKYLSRPTWPAAASGVTIMIGYDLRFNSKAVIRQDLAGLIPERDIERLVAAQGLSGAAAKSRAAQLRDISIPWDVAMEVFEKTTVVKFDQLCQRTWPGYDVLRGHAQDSLLSLTFNRGSSLVGERRRHMRTIASLSPKRDYDGMAAQERAMISIWRGTAVERGMTRRRTAEAKLMETP